MRRGKILSAVERHQRISKAPEYVLQIGKLTLSDQGGKITIKSDPVEIEDLIPLSLCIRAARRYATEFWGAERS